MVSPLDDNETPAVTLAVIKNEVSHTNRAIEAMTLEMRRDRDATNIRFSDIEAKLATKPSRAELDENQAKSDERWVDINKVIDRKLDAKDLRPLEDDVKDLAGDRKKLGWWIAGSFLAALSMGVFAKTLPPVTAPAAAISHTQSTIASTTALPVRPH